MKRVPLAITASVLASLLTAGGLAVAQVPGVNSTLQSVFNLVYDNSTMKPTYSATGNFATVASASDICSISGSASKTVKVRRVILSVAGGTTGVTEAIALVKRSTAYTAGAGGTMAQVPYDSVNSLTGAANVGTVGFAEYWTSNPTVGTFAGSVADPYVNIATSVLGGTRYTFTLGELGSPVVLRGVAQNLAVNFNGVTVAGAASCTFEWTED